MGFFTRAAPINGTLSMVGRFCREAGWTANQRSEKSMVVFIRDSIGYDRPVIVSTGKFVVIGADSLVTMQQVPGEIAGMLLMRNDDLVYAKWSAYLDDGEVGFRLFHLLPAEILNAAIFRTICDEMVEEIGGFDGQMQRAGYLG